MPDKKIPGAPVPAAAANHTESDEALNEEDLAVNVFTADTEDDPRLRDVQDDAGDDDEEIDDEDADDETSDESEESDEDETEESDDADEKADDDEEEEDPTADMELTPRVKRQINKRMGKMTAQIRDLEAEKQAIQARLQEAEAQAVAPGAMPENLNPIMVAETESEIQEYEQYLEDTLDTLEDYEDGTELLDDAELKRLRLPKMTAQEVRRERKALKRAIERTVPQARAALAARNTAAAQARKVYPTLFDKTSDDYHKAQRILKANPSMRQDPNYMQLVGDMLLGAKVREQRAAKVKGNTRSHQATKPRVIKKSGIPTARQKTGARRMSGDMLSDDGSFKSDAVEEMAMSLLS